VRIAVGVRDAVRVGWADRVAESVATQ
jgi:hypothetical protein